MNAAKRPAVNDATPARRTSSRNTSSANTHYMFSVGDETSSPGEEFDDSFLSPLTTNNVARAKRAFSASRSSGDGPFVKKKKAQPRRSKWTHEEDAQLLQIMQVAETFDSSKETAAKAGGWIGIAATLDNGRSSKQCRDRWLNYLRPGLKKGEWSTDEEELIRDMYSSFGPRWTAMAKIFENRTDNDIKNKWYSMSRSQQLQNSKLGIVHDLGIASKSIDADHYTFPGGHDETFASAASSILAQTGSPISPDEMSALYEV